MRHLLPSLAIVLGVGCSTAQSVRSDSVAAPAAEAHTAADVRFMRDMIAHHGQALIMSELAPTRTERQSIRLLAERIAVSQRDEIELMENWLRRRGDTDDSAPHHEHSHAGHAMPGMATDDDLSRLGSATGDQFDRLFLELMIRHHEGALVMVAELFQTPGAAQRSEVYRIASEIDADQRAEIARMRALRNGLPGS